MALSFDISLLLSSYTNPGVVSFFRLGKVDAITKVVFITIILGKLFINLVIESVMKMACSPRNLPMAWAAELSQMPAMS